MICNELPPDFDWKAYVNLNPDLLAANFDEKKCLRHWSVFGYKENRQYKYGDIKINPIEKMVVYTCITNDYDMLREVLNPEKNIPVNEEAVGAQAKRLVQYNH